MDKETDVNWNHASETAEMLRQATAHIELSMREGNDSIQSLTASFNAIIEHLGKINEQTAKLPDGEVKDSIEKHTQYCTEQNHAAIVSMQFYDTLTQRLQFIAESLHSLSELIRDKKKRGSESQWLDLQNNIARRCHIEADAVFLDAIRAGQSFDEAHRLSLNIRQSKGGDIDLF